MKKKIFILFVLLIGICGCGKQKDLSVDQDKIAKLLELNYYYAVYKEGSFNLDNGGIEIDGIKYYSILFDSSLSLSDIRDLPYKIFTEKTAPVFYEESLKKVEYVETSSGLFARKLENGCTVQKNYDFTQFIVKQNTPEYYVIKYNDLEFYVYKIDGELYLNYNVFKCDNE